MPTDTLSDHFRLREFACHDGSATPLEAIARLRFLCVMVLEPIRKAWGMPLVVVSGWRSPVHNLRVGGALASFHLLGDAADIAPVDLDRVEELHALIQREVREGLPLGALGLYPNWIHVDVRKRKANGAIATWRGRGVGSEVV